MESAICNLFRSTIYVSFIIIFKLELILKILQQW